MFGRGVEKGCGSVGDKQFRDYQTAQRPTDDELIKCHDCRVWDPENQPGVMAKLLEDPNAYADRKTLLVKNGMTLGFPGGTVPLWTELLLCTTHAERVE